MSYHEPFQSVRPADPVNQKEIDVHLAAAVDRAQKDWKVSEQMATTAIQNLFNFQ
jgi:hypothetical protein